MKNMFSFILAVVMLLTLTACGNSAGNNPPPSDAPQVPNSPAITEDAPSESASSVSLSAQSAPMLAANTLYLHIGSEVLTAALSENTSTEALKELVAAGNITIDMSDYGGFEKVGSIGTYLPTNDERITSESGDLILYQGNSLVIFYAPNTWSCTRLGKINDITQDELKTFSAMPTWLLHSHYMEMAASWKMDILTRTVL